MDNRLNYTLVLVLLLGWLYKNYEWLKIQVICWIIITRGIIAPNRFWWAISDLFLEDSSAVNLYMGLRNKYKKKIYPINIFGTTVNVVIDNNYVKQVLDKSPFTFGVGTLKKGFFKSFMAKNVGVSEGYNWIRRREVNEKTLDTDCFHRYSAIYHGYLAEIVRDIVGGRGEQIDFTKLGKRVTSKIVFGKDHVVDPIFRVFSKANSIWSVVGGGMGIDLTTSPDFKIYHEYLGRHIQNPVKYSLIAIACGLEDNYEELMHHIPHWIFPIVGQYINSLPRFLLLLQHYPTVLAKLEYELSTLCNGINGNNISASEIYKLEYLRWCLLETFRLHNPVVTTFRTLLNDYNFESGDNNESEERKYSYKKGDEFLILNHPTLRDPEFWKEPNKFVPERWSQPGLENSYYAIMFNQGPQRCPGKELILFLLQSTIYWFWVQRGSLTFKSYYPKINPENIPQMTNPFNIFLS